MRADKHTLESNNSPVYNIEIIFEGAVLIGVTLSKSYILSLASNADVFARGENYYKTGRVAGMSFDNGSVSVSVEGNYKNYDIILRFSQLGEFEEYKCGCDSDRIWEGACKHVIAALLAVSELNAEALNQTSGEALARKLSDNLERQIYRRIDETIVADPSASDGQKLRVWAKLFLYAGKKPYLNFFVGNNRMYAVKSVNEFVANLKKQNVASYGSNLRFRHSLSVFDGDSQGLLNFIVNENETYYEISKSIMENYNYMYMAKENARDLPLTERNADDFFELYADRALDTDGGEIRLTDGMPPVRFEVESALDEVALKGERFDYFTISGKRYDYFLSGAAVYRTEKSRGAILNAIAESFRAGGAPRISFSGGERVKFISVILPYLYREGMISLIPGDLDFPEPGSMTPKLYFSLDGADVICRIAFCYGEAEINPLTPQEIAAARDIPHEYRIIRHLCMYGFEPDASRGVYKLSEDDAIFRLLHDGLEDLNNQAEIYSTKELMLQKPKAGNARVNIRLSSGFIELALEGSDFSFAELIEAMSALRQKKKYHRLKDGRFIDLDDENVRDIAQFINSLDLSEKDAGAFIAELPKYRSYYIDQLTEGSKAIDRSEEFQRLASEFKEIKGLSLPQPETLQGELREYQKIGFNWLTALSRFGFGGVLADDMGLGKTVQVIAYLLNACAPGTSSLIVSPTSLIYNWENELKRFAPSLRVQTVAGAQEKRREALDAPADVYITTYDSLKRDREFYIDRQYETLIADEAQYIKNPDTQNAKAVKSITAKHRFALTGTPIENSLTELWSIFDFVMPGYLFSALKFSRLYETPIVKQGDSARADALKKQISPFLLRRVKSEVLTELPEKTETHLYADMLPEQQAVYMAQLLKARDMLNSGASRWNRVKIFAELTRLRQICCHPSLCVEDYKSGSCKLLLALETIQMSLGAGHRILLFSQFTSMLSILREELRHMGTSYFYLDGSTPAAERVDMAEKFNAGARDMFLISLKAGGTGLNLTGADVVIHYDPWWNPSVMGQATDRAHRIGQKQAVQVFYLLTRGTVEQKIMDLHEKKKDLIDSVIAEGDQFLGQMSDEEILELFGAETI